MLGGSHRLYERVSDVTLVKRQTPKRKPNPQTPEQARTIREALGKHGDSWWSMCCTGMMPDELWGRKWKDGPNYIHILGTKRTGRDRKVPRLCTPKEPLFEHPTAFSRALKAATNGSVQPYDARRTFMFWMEEAGIQRTRRKMYHGHATKDITELYERHEVAAFLDSDADLLRQHLGDENRHLEMVNT